MAEFMRDGEREQKQLCKYIQNIIPNKENATYRSKVSWYYFAS